MHYFRQSTNDIGYWHQNRTLQQTCRHLHGFTKSKNINMEKNLLKVHANVSSGFFTRDTQLSKSENQIQSLVSSLYQNPSDISLFLTQLSSVAESLYTDISNQDKPAVKFNCLGFCIQHDCSTWMALNSPVNNLGLVSDVYSVIEHIYQLRKTSDNTIKDFYDNQQFKLHSPAQHYCVTSFDQNPFRFSTQRATISFLRRTIYFYPFQHSKIGKNRIRHITHVLYYIYNIIAQ